MAQQLSCINFSVSRLRKSSFGDLPLTPKAIGLLGRLLHAPKAMGPLGDLVRSPKAIVQWLIRTFATDAFGSLARPPHFTERPRGARVRLRT